MQGRTGYALFMVRPRDPRSDLSKNRMARRRTNTGGRRPRRRCWTKGLDRLRTPKAHAALKVGFETGDPPATSTRRRASVADVHRSGCSSDPGHDASRQLGRSPLRMTGEPLLGPTGRSLGDQLPLRCAVMSCGADEQRLRRTTVKLANRALFPGIFGVGWRGNAAPRKFGRFAAAGPRGGGRGALP